MSQHKIPGPQDVSAMAKALQVVLPDLIPVAERDQIASRLLHAWLAVHDEDVRRRVQAMMGAPQFDTRSPSEMTVGELEDRARAKPLSAYEQVAAMIYAARLPHAEEEEHGETAFEAFREADAFIRCCRNKGLR